MEEKVEVAVEEKAVGKQQHKPEILSNSHMARKNQRQMLGGSVARWFGGSALGSLACCCCCCRWLTVVGCWLLLVGCRCHGKLPLLILAFICNCCCWWLCNNAVRM